MRIVLFFIIFFASSFGLYFGQNQIRSVTEMTRFDFFQGVEFQKSKRLFQPFAGFSIGINRSIFQLQPYPRLSVGFFLDEEDGDKFQAGPIFMESISMLKVDPTISGTDVYNECYVGLAIQYGGKWKLYSRLLAGWLYHQFPTSTGVYSINSVGFSLGIGVVYVLERE